MAKLLDISEVDMAQILNDNTNRVYGLWSEGL
jgi:hypothetical protein